MPFLNCILMNTFRLSIKHCLQLLQQYTVILRFLLFFLRHIPGVSKEIKCFALILHSQCKSIPFSVFDQAPILELQVKQLLILYFFKKVFISVCSQIVKYIIENLRISIQKDGIIKNCLFLWIQEHLFQLASTN